MKDKAISPTTLSKKHEVKEKKNCLHSCIYTITFVRLRLRGKVIDA